jgi:hypothetical protein
MLQEVISISRTTLHSCRYALQIMMMIERVTGWEFLKDHEITDLKPQNRQLLPSPWMFLLLLWLLTPSVLAQLLLLRVAPLPPLVVS